ncbi:MAG: carboxymuconolactone decarboxylase family protein [Psychroserpens sp.]|uniref:carboxymuconolactone decarboxylase family protein n=1 Tax=Psychroserpens sp. TaxID=2020870 RepID=UPI0030016D6A
MNSTIEIRHLELVRLRIGYLNNCNYSISLHFNELKNFGETDLRLSLVSVWNHVPHFSVKERALFALTDYIISTNNDDELESIHTLLEPHFSNDQITDLSNAIKQIDLWTRSMKHTNDALS